jgi:hypothetical protein
VTEAEWYLCTCPQAMLDYDHTPLPYQPVVPTGHTIAARHERLIVER